MLEQQRATIAPRPASAATCSGVRRVIDSVAFTPPQGATSSWAAAPGAVPLSSTDLH